MSAKRNSVEVHIAVGYRVFCAALFIGMGVFVGCGFMVAPIFPQWIGAADDIAQGNFWVKTSVFIGRLGIFLLFLYPLWLSLFFRVRAGASVLCFNNGFHTQTVKWNDVASYRIEPNPRWYRARNRDEELVLRGADASVLLRLPAEILVNYRAAYVDGEKLWEFVEIKLAGKNAD